MFSTVAPLKHRAAVSCSRVWFGVSQRKVHVRSSSETEAGVKRSDAEHPWETESPVPFSRARIGTFFQQMPVLRNPFSEDVLLRGYLKRHLPSKVSVILIVSICGIYIYTLLLNQPLKQLCSVCCKVLYYTNAKHVLK